jgi:hypothetical protein
MRGASTLLCLLAVGCTARYVPKRPDTQSTVAGNVTPTRISRTRPGDEQLTLRTSLASETRLHGAYSQRGHVDPFASECTGEVIETFRVDGEPAQATVEVGGRRRIELSRDSFEDYVLLELETARWRGCAPVRIDWPGAWRRAPVWEGLFLIGADFNVVGHDSLRGIGGIRLGLARWSRGYRVGLELGAVNGELHDDEASGAYIVPFALEGDRVVSVSEDVSLGAAFIGVGLRGVAYLPVPETEERGTLVLSPQAVLRMIGSFPPVGHDVQPAGLTLDHVLVFGPGFAPETGASAFLFGYSMGVGWAW